MTRAVEVALGLSGAITLFLIIAAIWVNCDRN